MPAKGAAYVSLGATRTRRTSREGNAMSQETVVVPVVVPIERYTVLMGAFASRDPGRAPSQNIQIFLSPPPNHDLRTILVFFKVDARQSSAGKR
jgi:hypothetical protein